MTSSSTALDLLQTAARSLTRAERTVLIRDAIGFAQHCADRAADDPAKRGERQRLGSWHHALGVVLAEIGDEEQALLRAAVDDTAGVFLGDATDEKLYD